MYHHAGLADPGSSSTGGSYIDAVILRDRDANTGWANAADSTMEERIHYCQNWRADVVALINSSGGLVQHVRYGEYGDPFGIPAGDTDGDGDADSTDESQIQSWEAFGPYDIRGDLDLDGDVDGTDVARFKTATLGWGALSLSVSTSGGGNRKGYAGYETDDVVIATLRLNHVRNRVYNVALGRWMTRDPIGYGDGWNLYEYGMANPLFHVDAMGTFALPAVIAPALASPLGPAVIIGAGVGLLIYHAFFRPAPVWNGPLVAAPGMNLVDPLNNLLREAWWGLGALSASLLTTTAEPIRVAPKEWPRVFDNECEFYLAWCLWHESLGPYDPGKGWERAFTCLECYALCELDNGRWPLILCGSGNNGPRWPDPVAPPPPGVPY